MSDLLTTMDITNRITRLTQLEGALTAEYADMETALPDEITRALWMERKRGAVSPWETLRLQFRNDLCQACGSVAQALQHLRNAKDALGDIGQPPAAGGALRLAHARDSAQQWESDHK